jgi:hypothetical protein
MYYDDHQTLRFLDRELDSILLEVDRSRDDQDDFAQFERRMNEERLQHSRERHEAQSGEHRR